MNATFTSLVKNRKTIRCYQKKAISRNVIDDLIKAAGLAPSIHNIQPWYFMVLISAELRRSLVKMLKEKSSQLITTSRIFLDGSLKIMESAPVVILVFNTCSFSRRARRIGNPYESVIFYSELQSVAAAIQNLFLLSSEKGIGGAWLTSPLLLKGEISSLVKVDFDLIAILTLGYPAESPSPKPRKKLAEIRKFM